MRSIDEAFELVIGQVHPKAPVAIRLDDAIGRVLAQNVFSDLDMPPYDKALVDGYAIVADDVGQCADLKVIGEIAAGENPTLQVERGTAARIMTGAPIPAGADSVVMIERTDTPSWDITPDRVAIRESVVTKGQGIMIRGAEMTAAQQVLSSGTEIRAIELGVLAEVGCAEPIARPIPEVAILSTGDELVECSRRPGPGQIRNSNGTLLAALARTAGAAPKLLGIARDDPADLQEKMVAGLRHDMLLVSGGVSAGKFDLVPKVFDELGVREVFHHVNLRPGKPLWFGVQDGEAKPNDRKCVFGLPGNPVSVLVCFELFVRPALRKLIGADPRGRRVSAELANTQELSGKRPTYWPCHLNWSKSAAVVEPLPWRGSPDLLSLSKSDALAFFPNCPRTYQKGEIVDVLTPHW